MIPILGVVYIAMWLKYRISLRDVLQILYVALVQMFSNSTVDQQPWGKSIPHLEDTHCFYCCNLSVQYFIVYKMLLHTFLINFICRANIAVFIDKKIKAQCCFLSQLLNLVQELPMFLISYIFYCPQSLGQCLNIN